MNSQAADIFAGLTLKLNYRNFGIIDDQFTRFGFCLTIGRRGN